jgi:putative NADPH-quinone reductase
MNVLIVFAHPEPKSFNGAMKDIAVRTLREAGHLVQVFDLYAMRFDAVGLISRRLLMLDVGGTHSMGSFFRLAL